MGVVIVPWASQSLVHMLVHAYLIVNYHVQGVSGSVCVFTNPISLSIVMASLWVQRISNGCGHCALGVTSVEYMLLHVCNIVCYHVLSGSGSVSVSYEEVFSKNGHLPTKASLAPSFEVQMC